MKQYHGKVKQGYKQSMNYSSASLPRHGTNDNDSSNNREVIKINKSTGGSMLRNPSFRSHNNYSI